MLAKMIFTARMLLGVFYLISGLNWFFGFMPLPSIYTPLDEPMKHAVVLEMIRSGWMFQFAKVIEIAFGLSLLCNRAVPLMLIASLPVAFGTFMLDALILDDLWRWIIGTQSSQAMLAAMADMIVGGLCVLLIHLWLIGCYFSYYRPMLRWKAPPGTGGDPIATSEHPWPRWAQRGFLLLGVFAIGLQAFNLYLFIGMINIRG